MNCSIHIKCNCPHRNDLASASARMGKNILKVIGGISLGIITFVALNSIGIYVIASIAVTAVFVSIKSILFLGKLMKFGLLLPMIIIILAAVQLDLSRR